MKNKKYDFFKRRKISFAELDDEIKIEIALYDQMIYGCEMISGRPELYTVNEQG